jgi:hypothetical protein
VSGLQSQSGGNEPLAAAVSVLLEEARWAFDDERQRGERLETGLALLTGFASLIVVLVGPVGLNPLDGVTGIFVNVFYGGALLLLALTALFAVSLLFKMKIVWLDSERDARPRGRMGVDDEVLERFSGELSGEPAIEVERTMIATLRESIKDQRDLNRVRWTRFRLGALTFVAALLLIVAEWILLLFAF